MVPSLNMPVAVNAWLLPSARFALAGVTAMDVSVTGVGDCDPLQPPRAKALTHSAAENPNEKNDDRLRRIMNHLRAALLPYLTRSEHATAPSPVAQATCCDTPLCGAL